VYKHWPGKTNTEYDDHLFCMITMNHHPLHTNDWFAAQSVQGRNVVVGNLVYSLVLGMSVPDVSGAAIANLDRGLRHRAQLPRRHRLRRHPGARQDRDLRRRSRVVKVGTISQRRRGCTFVARSDLKQDHAPAVPLRRHVPG
jgi:hypothetical protein